MAAADSDQLAGLLRGETVWIEVAGSSMWPLLRAGDRLRVRPNAGSPRPGEVAVAVFRGALIAHRVVDVRSDAVTLQGDAARGPDPVFRPVELVGLVVAAYSPRGRLRPILDGGAWPAWRCALPLVRRTRSLASRATRPLRRPRSAPG